MSNDTTNQLQEQTDYIAEMLIAAYEDRLYTDEFGNMEVLDEGDELPDDCDTVASSSTWTTATTLLQR